MSWSRTIRSSGRLISWRSPKDNSKEIFRISYCHHFDESWQDRKLSKMFFGLDSGALGFIKWLVAEGFHSISAEQLVGELTLDGVTQEQWELIEALDGGC